MTSKLDPSALDEDGFSPWNKLVIGEFVFKRTIVDLTGPGIEHKNNKKHPVGASGGGPSYQGTLPAEFTLSWLLWDEDRKGLLHFSTWEKLSRVVVPAEAKQQPAKMKVYHPRLAFLNLSGREFFFDHIHPLKEHGPQIVQVVVDISQASLAAKKKATKVAPTRSSGEATEQARQRFNELAAQLANEDNPITQSQIRNQMDDIGRRYPVIGPPAPSKTSTKP